MGFEPTINRVIRCSPRFIVGSSGAGEVVCSALSVSARTKVEPAAAAESPKRNSLRPIAGTVCMSESILAQLSQLGT